MKHPQLFSSAGSAPMPSANGFRGESLRLREGLAPSRDVLSMSLLGAVSASFRNRPIDLKLRKGAAMLGYLCLQENFVARRDRLAFLLWSESDGNSARTSLRQTLITLRKAFDAVGCDALRTTKLTVGLNPEALDTDIRRVLATTEEGRIDEALLSVELLPETLLEGMEDLDEEFRTWLLPTRQALHNRLEASLSARLNDAATSEPVRVQAARALLCIDPTNENALRHEVASIAKRGDIVGALRSYRRFEKLLGKEYGVKPSAELQMLITQVQREAPQHSNLIDLPELDKVNGANPKREAEQDASDLRSHQTIVIRLDPFAIEGIDASRNYLVSAFRHALTASLVRFREWVVVDARLEDNSAPSVADYALQATIYELDGGIEVVLTLKRVLDSSYLWSQIISLQIERWLATQHEIVRGVATTLRVHISAERMSRGLNRPIGSATVFDQWLRAQDAIFSLDRFRLSEAREKLALVVRANPTYAPLYSASAQIENIESMMQPGVFRNRKASQAAIADARRAVQLDPLDSRAHLAFGWAQAFAWEFEAAMPHMQLAVELNESDPWPNISSALFWAFANQTEKAVSGMEAVRRRSRVTTPTENAYLAKIHFLRGEYQIALSVFDRFGTIAPTIAPWIAAAMALSRRKDDAKKVARSFIDRTRAMWAGKIEPTEEAIVSWFMQTYPLRHYAHWTRVREGLQLSGLPVQHLTHAAFVATDHMQNVEV
jgi:DNA-binding SARP family transcriptional activator